MRLMTLCCAALVALGCSEESEDELVEDVRPDVPEDDDEPQIESLEGVDVSRLDRQSRALWVDAVNELLSPCGDPVTVAECVQERGECRQCAIAARYVARLAQEGADDREIRELYALRYDEENEQTIEVGEAPVRGPQMGAPITIVEFSDFECPYCREAHPILARTVAEFEGRVRLVFKHYPLSAHEHALPAARAAVAAMRQGKFWEMHDTLFENQHALTPSDLERYAREIGLDVERFREDLASEESLALVQADRALGQEVGVQGTPTIFVNGRKFREPPDSLPAYIRETLDSL